MREFRKRKFIAIVESVMTMMATICIVITLIDGDILGFVLGVCWVFAQVGLVAVSFDLVSKARACLDLREVYPPKRDRFHRDLERLNKLRGEPPMVLPPKPQQKRQRSDDAVDHLEGSLNAALAIMVPILVVTLFGAVIGLVVSLL